MGPWIAAAAALDQDDLLGIERWYYTTADLQDLPNNVITFGEVFADDGK